MNAKRFYYTLIGSLVLLVAGVGAMAYFGNVLMKKTSEKLVNAKLDNIANETEEANYAQAKKNLEKYSDLSELVAKILPSDKDQARAVSEIYKIGKETGVTITKIEFPSSTLGQKAASSSSTTDTSASSATASTAGTVTQAKAVTGLSSVLGIDINITNSTDTTYGQMINFLQKIESNRRSMQIKKISVRPNNEKNVLNFDLTVTIFVKP